MLISLGQDEVASIIAEQGSVSVSASSAAASISLDPLDVAHLFAHGIESSDMAALHDGARH